MKAKAFSSATRAEAGCIVTFDRDGERWSRHFYEVVHTKGPRYNRVSTRSGGMYVDQAIEYADQHDAKIVCISTPATILRDLSGTRAALKSIVGFKTGRETQPPDAVQIPEYFLLGRRKRLDLLFGR